MEIWQSLNLRLKKVFFFCNASNQDGVAATPYELRNKRLMYAY